MTDRDKKFDTCVLDDLNIVYETTPISYEDIRENEKTFQVFLNEVKTRDETYKSAIKNTQKLQEKLEKANEQISCLREKTIERRDSVIFMAIAEFLLSVGFSGIISEKPILSDSLIIIGVLLSVVSLYFNFKK